MKSKLNYLIGLSLKRKIKTKWFLWVNVLLAILIIGITNVDSIIQWFGGDFDDKQKVYVIDQTQGSKELFEEQLKVTQAFLGTGEDKERFIVEPYEGDAESARSQLTENKKDILVIFEDSEQTVITASVISYGFIDTINYQLLTTAIQNTKIVQATLQSNVSLEELAKIQTPIEIQREVLDESKDSEDESMETIMATVFPFFILPVFMLTMFLVQMIGAEVNDEKATRGMEIIISNVSPTTHFFAKVISGNLFILTQGALLFVFGAIGIWLRSTLGGNEIVGGLSSEVGSMLEKALSTGLGEQLLYIIPLTLLLMVLTFVAYALLAGILASMTTNIEDFQQLQSPLIIISLIGYYLAMMAGMFKGALFIKIFSFIPLISAILSPSLLIMGQIGIVEVLISITITIIFIWALIKYGLRIYKVGILNYSTTGLWKKMFKALKN